MIIFGTRGKTVSGPVIESHMCEHCGHNEYVTFGLLRYFHLYWIPSLVTSKKIGMECTHCRKSYMESELSQEQIQGIKPHVFNYQNTLPYFSGAILFGCFILLLLCMM
ncbi:MULTISPECIES: hypothetical protein [Vibrio]|uniref:Zinc-ribbon 15 domain-containing protein n=2 Tax=Vibrio TaxID=662 RepID=A0A7X4LHZ9_9VIBR|nr:MULTISPECIES: hypothetical protein [Vibrio]MBF9003284.1 hypothetical protein [Vibrio nitrifigilis]MZI92007.1 hypothetical protein [Vibrio eleionomae]